MSSSGKVKPMVGSNGSGFKNPLSKLIGTAKSKLRRSQTPPPPPPKTSDAVTPITNGGKKTKSNKTRGRQQQHQQQQQQQGGEETQTGSQYGGRAASRSASEPPKAPPSSSSASSSVRGAASTLSVENGSGRTSSTAFFRRRRRHRSNAIQPKSSGGVSHLGTPQRKLSHHHPPHLTPENRPPVFVLDVKTQNRRLVTPRQRQEIYALNRVMTRLENDRFKQFCGEKGFPGDLVANGGYDIFL